MISIKAEKRLKIGSFGAQECRAQNKIPANLYGKDFANINLAVDFKELTQSDIRRRHSIISLDIEGKTHQVLVQDIQYNSVTMNPVHVDFFALKKDERVKVDVPLRYLNVDKCVGVKQGGYLNKIYRTLPLLLLPGEIMNEIVIDTIDFNIGKVVRVIDIELPEGVKPLKSSEVVLCNIIGRVVKKEADVASEGAKEEAK